jgi:2-dehydropantoate 2-reductase
MGSGGVGGYFGGRLAAAGADVTFIARGRHLEALRTTGLRIQSPKGNLHLQQVKATDDPKAIGPVDIVFFTVKLYDSDAATQQLPPLIGQDTAVISFQNGVDSTDVLTKACGDAHVAGGTAYIAAVIAEPGLIRHTAMDRLIFGELDGARTPRLERLLDACRPAGFDATSSDHIIVDIWSKFVRLSTFSGMTTVTRSPIGVIREDPDLLRMLQQAAKETIAVARAKGIAISDAVLDETTEMALKNPPETKSSMLEDLERGRPLELPWLSAAVVRLGREVGIDAPTHRFIATVLKPFVSGAVAVLSH